MTALATLPPVQSAHARQLSEVRRDLETVRVLLAQGRLVAAVDVIVDTSRRLDGEIACAIGKAAP